jgi:sulfatase maturation enzyme AslB (radical SAM superfamily)
MTALPPPLALTPQQQTHLLEGALPAPQGFERSLAHRGQTAPRRSPLRVLQLNLGRLCNMRCSHCHVDAGPHQGHTLMPDAVVEHCIAAIARQHKLPVLSRDTHFDHVTGLTRIGW